ncbi:PD-(D/E)XK nuclease family protein [Paenibacillus aestuarii]|uniref:PD-(D/E)XK nuclease family protein n=1 Tax=Paenibacillus aestuarii TaxID=516965 RepID=A0ABW0KHT0_9BACL|nr:PD-(D/E)XK nuclease family protein [Paenibacillus aestuarii]
MEDTFFETLSVAHLEKIHSQMLCWILNGDILDLAQKTRMLNSIFGTSETTFSKLDCYTEYKSMDIVVVTDKITFIIENKLKSSQHSDQLERYMEIIQEDSRFKDTISKFGFLTLVGEESKHSEWKNIIYRELLDSLRNVFVYNEEIRNPSHIIFNEYLKTLANLVDTFEKFDKNHKDFQNVFEEATKKKYEKLNTNYGSEEKKYISRVNLESVFQEHFLRKIAQKIIDINKYSYHIGNTNGNALLHIDLSTNNKINGFDFNLGFQYQDNTLKFNIGAVLYKQSNSSWLPQEVYDYFENLSKNTKFSKYNPPKYRAYTSVSKKLDKEVYELDEGEFVQILNEYIDECKVLIGMFTEVSKQKKWERIYKR